MDPRSLQLNGARSSNVGFYFTNVIKILLEFLKLIRYLVAGNTDLEAYKYNVTLNICRVKRVCSITLHTTLFCVTITKLTNPSPRPSGQVSVVTALT